MGTNKARHKLGLYTIVDAAEAFGLKYDTFYQWIDKGLVPGPSHKCGNRLWYTEKDMEQFRKKGH